MFERLQKKWKVGATQLLLIICTFAIGGSLTGYIGKKLMNLLSLERGALWLIVYILLVTLLWPLSVLLVSIFFGQYRFFTQYLRKMGQRMKIIKKNEQFPVSLGSSVDAENKVIRVAIFASGAGSNAKKIIEYLRDSSLISSRVEVALIVCNKPGAGVLQIAAQNHIPTLLIEKERFFRGDAYINELKQLEIDFVVLAGFLWKVPDALIRTYRDRIVNIHPALLPAYGGKGMYGHHVHEAVIASGEKESGITIHYVDEKYDNGDVIFQARCPVVESDTADSLAARIHQLEHLHYPVIIEKLLMGLKQNRG
jgi:formyltetrahydrofolate-dependent phosphoribosylglycinamide formyltransferase